MGSQKNVNQDPVLKEKWNTWFKNVVFLCGLYLLKPPTRTIFWYSSREYGSTEQNNSPQIPNAMSDQMKLSSLTI